MSSASVRGERGFSLVEILVATGVLASALMSLGALFSVCSERLLAARLETHASMLARARLDELIADPDVLRDGAQGSDRVDARGAPARGLDGMYQRRWSMVPLAADPARLLMATVEVTTPSGVRRHAGAARMMTLVERRRP